MSKAKSPAVSLTPEQLEAAKRILAGESTTNGSNDSDEKVNDLPLVPPAQPSDPDPKSEGIKLPSAEYELLQKLKQEKRIWDLKAKAEALGNDYASRRNTLILRRANKLYPDLVPMEDVIAYSDIYKMRDSVTAKGKKVSVSEEEIEVYHQLEASGKPITLAAIMEITKNSSGSDSENE